MEPEEVQRRLADLERAQAQHCAEQDRQIQDITTRVEILEKFLTDRYG